MSAILPRIASNFAMGCPNCLLSSAYFIASLIITSTFIILVLNLFHAESQYCILPKSFTDIDTNKDGKISPDEIKKAYETLKKAGKIK